MIASKLCSVTIRATTPLQSVSPSRTFSDSSKDQKLNSILKKPTTSTVKTKPPRPLFPIRKHCIFFATANSGLPVSNVTKFHNLRNADHPSRIPRETMRQARAYVTPDQWSENPAPRGFPRLRHPGQNTDYQFFDPAFHTRQQQIAQVKNRLRNQGLLRTPDDTDDPRRPWGN